MRIKGVKIYISPIVLGVFIVFLVLFIVSSIITGKSTYVIWGCPLCLLLIILPLISTYNLGVQYKKLLPDYEKAAIPHRIADINQSLQGHAVKIEGTVQTVRMKWMGRPRYTIYDGTASIVVFRSLPLDEPLGIGDTIAVLGMVVKKYAVAGSMSVHAVGVTKITELSEIEPAPAEPEKEDLKIKKYN